MATPAQLRMMTTARPFQPFRIKLAGGTVYVVQHPENAASDMRGREMAIFDDQGMHLVEMLLVEVIEPIPSPAASKTDGDGES